MRYIASVVIRRESCKASTHLLYELANLACSQVKRIQNVIEEQNYLSRIRKHTDVLYRWAK